MQDIPSYVENVWMTGKPWLSWRMRVTKKIPFYLEGTTSISIRDAIFLEVASNILIHRGYTNAFPAKLIVEHGQVRTENSNRPHGFGFGLEKSEFNELE